MVDFTLTDEQKAAIAEARQVHQARMAEREILPRAALAKAGFTVGDNEPYSGALENDCLYSHGTRHGLPHVLIEMRQDLVASPEAARAFAIRLKPAIDSGLAEMGPAEIRITRPLTPAEGGSDMCERRRTALASR